MLAQLKTVVLIKEAIKLAFFGLVEYLEHQHLWAQIYLNVKPCKVILIYKIASHYHPGAV
jgi:hypothetical protein